MSTEQLFWQRVAETQEWCSMRIHGSAFHSKFVDDTSTEDLDTILRSAVFGSPTLIPTWTPRGNVWCNLPAPDRKRLQAAEDARCSVVDSLSDRRSRMLTDEGRHPGTVREHLLDYRFLVYLPETNLACGSAAWVSLGYFDHDNVPPWDTWLIYSKGQPGTLRAGKLICWVPPQLAELVDDAIRANPEECIYWATEQELFPTQKPGNKLFNWG